MIETLFCANQALDETTIAQVLNQQQHTTYGEGALGRLDEIVLKLASHQQQVCPVVGSIWVAIFAADHGVISEGLDDFEPTQSSQWVNDLLAGRAFSSALIKEHHAHYEVIDVGLIQSIESHANCCDAKVAAGTQNMVKQPAMSQSQLMSALEVGIASAERAHAAGAKVFVTGELGVGQTASALAMTAVLSGKPVTSLLEMGKQKLMRSERHQADVIHQAIERHQDALTSPLNIVQHLGGFETAALCGAMIRCAQLGLTVIVDGLMATVAAWVADLVSRNDQLLQCRSVEQLMDLGQYSVPETLFCICGSCPRLVEWCFFSHQTSVSFHALVLDILAVDPLLKFEMRLGQACGALLVLPLLKQACLIQNQFVSGLPEALRSPNIEETDCPFI